MLPLDATLRLLYTFDFLFYHHPLSSPLHMRAILALIFLSGACLVFTGCESDMPPAQTNGVNKLERGISGQGTLTQPDKSDDPIIKEDTRTGN
jgi:hypothetical protein